MFALPHIAVYLIIISSIYSKLEFQGSKDWSRTVQGGMTEYFSQNDQINKLTVLSLNGLNEALARFVNANDTKAFHDLVK